MKRQHIISRGLILVLLLGGLLLAGRLALATNDAPSPPPEQVYVVSPWDGVFYAGEYLGGPPLVEIGSEVAPNTLVCRIEAEMLFDVEAWISGTVVDVLADDGQMVTKGQRLFAIQPSIEQAR